MQRQYIHNFFSGKFFRSEDKIDLSGFSNAALEQLNQFKMATQLQLQEAFTQHKTLDLAVEAKAPIIIVPQHPDRENTRVAVFDLGNFAIHSDLSRRPKDIESIQKKKPKIVQPTRVKVIVVGAPIYCISRKLFCYFTRA